jgi:glutathionylspermidine synthase
VNPAPPFHAGEALDPATFRKIRLRTIFECCKWDPQVEDVSVLAPYPLLLPPSTWREIASLAETLATETVAAEREILSRPELLKQLGLPRPIWKLLAGGQPATSGPRVMRFDFHFTSEGWRISEVNSDVPGGFVEADGFTRLMAEACGSLRATALAAKLLAESLVRSAAVENPTIALVHASAYSDDRQVMTFLAREIEKLGAKALLIDPSQVRWSDSPAARAEIATDWFHGEAHMIYRFFPAEWLPNLKRTCKWPNYFVEAQTPQSNPGWSLISQSKRFGIMLDQLRTATPAWKTLLPQTCDVRATDRALENWVFKPALGRVGEAIGIHRLTPAKEWKQIRRNMFFLPNEWVAQRRFEILPLSTPDGPRYLCLGVYTIEGRAAGIYGRCSAHPIINHAAQDVAVLLKGEDR